MVMQTLLPRMLAVAVGGLTMAGVAASQYGHFIAAAGRFTYFDATSGNRLAYLLEGDHLDNDAPLIVLESGHQASHRYWHWVIEELARTHRVLAYSRAGYGASEYYSRSSYSLQESVDDLAELVSAVRGDRDVVLIGHSLGGYLVHRLASGEPFPIRALVLVDPTHPEEVLRVPSRREGAKLLDRSHATVVPSLRVGWGLLLETPEWLRDLPKPVARALRAEFRDFGAWAATRREWDSLHQLFRSPPVLAKVEAPVWVVAASKTLETAYEQSDLFDDYLNSGDAGGYRHVEGATHLTVLSSVGHARQVAEVARAAVGWGGAS